ncbi:MAG: hypothetical protein HY298_13950 [Verrucomicrobia bacterium]|nr:hypothetical protein [Verrucomicrobiota bacterium]
MKTLIKHLLLGAACLVASLTHAAPYLSEQLRLRATVQPSLDLGIGASTMYNPRFFDGKIYANQINTPCFGRYPIGSTTPEILVNNSANTSLEHRMVAPFRGTNRSIYLIGSSSAIVSTTTFTRYNYDGTNPVSTNTPDTQIADSFDWVDDNTIIYADYTSGNRKRLYLATVVAEPFSVTAKTTWNANGYITTSVSTRIRNVRVGEVYSGYAYYGDAGQNTNPNFYALDLATGTETLLGNLGLLTGSGSFGLWTVVERGGYLYVQTTDNGVYVYQMTSATTLGPLYATYTKAELDAVTGYTGLQYFGLDVTSQGRKLLLGDLQGKVYELGGPGLPYLAEELQLRVMVQPSADLSIGASTMYNPRVFDDKIFANQINTPCFGRYPSGSNTAEVLVNNSADLLLEHRMVAPFRGANRKTYMIGSSSAAASTTTFARYDFDGNNPVTIDSPDTLTVDAFDWVDDDTIIYAIYTSGNRNKLYLADVVAEPFSATLNTTWNANGYITTSVSARIRNVRVGDVFRGYAYYGDAGQNTNPNFYALNLATGAETLLGNLGILTGSGSFGLWTVVERDGYLYVQTTDNGVFIYKMTNATTLGPLYTTYTKAQLDAATGYTGLQYFGFDATVDGKKLLLGALEGKVFELEGRPLLGIAQSGNAVVLSWPATIYSEIIQSSGSLSPVSFSDLSPQPTILQEGELNTVNIPLGNTNTFFRLRKGP